MYSFKLIKVFKLITLPWLIAILSTIGLNMYFMMTSLKINFAGFAKYFVQTYATDSFAYSKLLFVAGASIAFLISNPRYPSTMSPIVINIICFIIFILNFYLFLI